MKAKPNAAGRTILLTVLVLAFIAVGSAASPYIQNFTLYSPSNNSILNDTTPTFNFSYSGANSSLPCAPLVNVNGGAPMTNITFLNTTQEATATTFTTLDSKPLSNGVHKWRGWCDSDDNTVIESSEVSNNRTFHIDTEAPTITFNTPEANANISKDVFINATVSDNMIGVDKSTVYLAVSNASGSPRHNYSSTGEQGDWTQLNKTAGGFFTGSVDISAFTSGDYTLWINASDDFGQRSHAARALTIDRTAPAVSEVTINVTSTGDDNITQNGYFNLTARVEETGTGIRACRALAREDGTLQANQSLGFVSDSYRNGTLDLTGQDGNYTITVACTDHAGNTGTNATLRMPDGTTTHRFPFDDSGPTIDFSTASPPHAAYTSSQHNISFNVTDFSGIRTTSLTIWFNDTVYSPANDTANFTVFRTWGENSSTAHLEIGVGSFTDSTNYTVDLSVNDTANDSTYNQTYWFHTDFTSPNITAITDITPDSDTHTRSSTTWHHEAVELNITCTDGQSYTETVSISGNNGAGGSTTLGSGTTEASVTFTADSGFEGSTSLDITCTDAAGNTATNTSSYHLDNRAPEIATQIPGPGDTIDASPSYDQQIVIEITDSGVGFSSPSSPDPQFDGSDISSYQRGVSSDSTTYYINWTQSIETNGTHSVSLDGGSALTVQDRFGQSLSINDWEFKVSGSDSGAVTTTDTGSNASLSVTDSPGSITLAPDKTRTVSITVTNDGGTTAAVDVSTSAGTGLTVTGTDTDGFDLAAGASQTVEVTIQAAQDFSGAADLTTTFSYSGDSVSETVTVNRQIGPAALTVVTAPDAVNVPRGNTSTLRFTVKNKGGQRIDGLESRFSQYVDSISPETVALIPNETRTVNITVSVPDDANISINNLTYEIGNDQISDSAYVQLRVQPATEQQRQQIIKSIKDLETKVQRIESTASQEAVEKLLDSANQAVTKGNYARAQQLAARIEDRVEQAELSPRDSGGLPLLPVALPIVILLAGGGVAAYIVARSKGRDSTRRTSGSAQEQDRFQEIRTAIDDTVSSISERISSAGSDSSTSGEETSTADQSSGRSRKKIRFENVDDE